jgi:hypothetical protein
MKAPANRAITEATMLAYIGVGFLRCSSWAIRYYFAKFSAIGKGI